MSTVSTPAVPAPHSAAELPRPAGLFRKLIRRPVTVGAIAFFVLMVLAAAAAPLIVGDPNSFVATERLRPPSPAHWFGTDNLGRDGLARVVYGARASLLVGAITCLLTTVIGTAVGIAAGMFRTVDLIVMRIVDGVMSFPVIVLALALMAILGPGLVTVVISMVIVFFPGVARVVRSTALVVSELPMIDAAKSAGAGRGRIFFRYVFPHCTTPVLVQAAIVFTAAVLVESALSFIGAGLPPDVPSWGAALAESRSYLGTAWWMWCFPGLALIGTVLSVNIVIDASRDILDPREADK